MIALLGADGMLGRAFRQHFVLRACLLEHTTARLAILPTPPALAAALDGADICINCAAYTDVDKAESEPEKANAINGDALENISAAARGKLLVHFSTDYVFPGDAAAPYSTDQIRDPINAYGRSKAIGEANIDGTTDLGSWRVRVGYTRPGVRTSC